MALNIANYINVTLALADRPGDWHIIPHEYSPFKDFESADKTKWRIPCINLKDKNGKPEGTISVIEITVT